MPVPLIVEQVTLMPGNPPHRQVQYVHGQLPGRETMFIWTHTHEQAMDYIENRLFGYFVRQAGRAVPLVVAQTADGERFLKASTDAERPDSLLALPMFLPAQLISQSSHDQAPRLPQG